ncbi:MAG: hypothetical protein LBM98_04380 [Oscillospiraceae bacterium]|nr:hypothetical protein [Oscillospiraceae bacterium]
MRRYAAHGAGYAPGKRRGGFQTRSPPYQRSARPRHCEAPVSPRYVGRYRCEAIQCRGDNIQPTYRKVLRQPWIASPHFIGTYRKCGGGFAKTGRAKPSPVPAHCAGTVDGVTSAHGAGRAGLKPAPTFTLCVPRNPRPALQSPPL